MQGAAYSIEQLSLFDRCEPPRGDTRDLLSGKMSPVHSAATGGWILRPCLKRSVRPKFQCLEAENGRQPEWYEAQNVTLRGGYWTLNTGESPSGEKESFLSQILEAEEDVPIKYYLSARACQGILRRAEERGKGLPPELQAVLIQQSKASYAKPV